MITWSDVTAIAPELATVAGGTQTAILADVATEVIVANWPSQEKADRASKYLAAHLATLSKRAGAAGPIQSQAVGGVSVSYAVSAMAAVLAATAYGQEYQRLQRLSFGGPWAP